MIGLLPCAGISSRLFNLPKFLLPLKNTNFSLLSNWCNILINNNCDKIIIGSSDTNFKFIEHIINTQLKEHISKIIIKLVGETKTMNETIYKMLIDEEYDIAIMGMPDTYIDNISVNLINKLKNNDDLFIGTYLWNIRKNQIGKIGQCNIDDNFVIDIVDKNSECDYNYNWGAIVFKPSFEKYINITEDHLGYAMRNALINNKIVYEILYDQYFDCGTMSEYTEYLNYLVPKKPIYIKGLIVFIAIYTGINITNEQLCITIECLKKVRENYKYETVVIIDNNSPNTEWYYIAKQLNFIILKNISELHKYEMGAYKHALQYYRADEYLCIQGNLLLNKRIDYKLDKNKIDAYAIETYKTHCYYSEPEIKELNNNLKILQFDEWDNNIDSTILWNCFYCNNIFMDEMLKCGLFDILCNNKTLSCLFERILGYFMRIKVGYIKKIDKNYYNKYFFNQS